MLIVGGGAALTAIAAYLAFIGVKSLRAWWRARQAERRELARHSERRHEARHEFHPAPGE
jgi:threonine/homoserine/homoserine lactone efflux protein